MEINDYILIHGKIANIKDDVDKKFIWFDITKDEYYKDKDGNMKNNPSFFSVRISKSISHKYTLNTNIEVVVKGIPKGYIDKNGYRQNYIHATEINGLDINRYEDAISSDTDGTMLWHGKRCESKKLSKKELDELSKIISDITGDGHE